jgi:hypothetical protein
MQMSHSKSIVLFVSIFLLHVSKVCAQQETTLQFLTWVPQANYTDLTIQPTGYKTSIALPFIGSMQAYYFNSAFKYNTLVADNTIDPNSVIPSLKNKNQLYSGGSYDLFSMRFKKKDTYFQFSIRDVWTQRFVYPYDLANIIWNGNSSYAGQTADLSNTRIALNYYREFGFAFNKAINDKLIIGSRVKFLTGLANVTTQESQTSLYTDPNGLSVSGHSEFTLLTSGLINDEVIKTSDILGFSNVGAALDLGGRYKLNEKISLACNVTNIGFIHWTKDVKNYRVNGDYTYTGYQIRDSADITNADWQNVLDTLEAVFKPKEDSDKYNSWLSPTVYLSGNYLLKENLYLYSSLALDVYHAVIPAFTIGATHTFHKVFQTTLNYTIMPNNYLNIGGGFAVRGGPFQYYMSCDNIVAVFDPYSVKYFNARLGLNIVLGRKEKNENVNVNLPKISG